MNSLAAARAKYAADRDEPARFRAAVLAVFVDNAWRSRGRVAAEGGLDAERLTPVLGGLAKRGRIEARGVGRNREYRRLPSIAPALAAVHDLVDRHPPSAPAPASTPAPSASGEAAEGPGALEDRLGRAVAAACRAFLAEWERP